MRKKGDEFSSPPSFPCFSLRKINAGKRTRGTELRVADADSLLSPPQLTTLQPLCCKMLAVPLWTNQRTERQSKGGRGEELREAGKEGGQGEGGVGSDVATATGQEQM